MPYPKDNSVDSYKEFIFDNLDKVASLIKKMREDLDSVYKTAAFDPKDVPDEKLVDMAPNDMEELCSEADEAREFINDPRLSAVCDLDSIFEGWVDV
jgi:uncharacterized membrane-anchored protein YhcB (DUF1043 family)